MTTNLAEEESGTGVSMPRRGIEIDAMFLANSLEVQHGLAYVLAGGWTRCWSPTGKLPFERTIPVMLMLRVPWDETNREHDFKLRIFDGEDANLLDPVEGRFKIGRQADLHVGMSQVQVVGMAFNVRFEAEGIYHIAVEVDGDELKRIDFEVFERRPAQVPA